VFDAFHLQLGALGWLLKSFLFVLQISGKDGKDKK
jgi:hypothetical protein